MSKLEFVLNRAGVKQLLKSQEMQEVCESYAEEVASKCGDGYEVDTYVGKNRANASVRTVTAEAVRDNFENNTLEKALH